MKIYSVITAAFLSTFTLGLLACGGNSQEAQVATTEPQKQLVKVVTESSPTVIPAHTVLPTIPSTNISSPTATAVPTQVPPTSTPSPTATVVPTEVPPTLTPTPAQIIPVTSSEKILCEDKVTYTYCLSSELLAPPSTPPDTWGAIVSFSPEVFCSTDVSDEECALVISSLLAAMMAWGNYGPLEYWVLGPEVESMEKLANVNCQRRVDRGDYIDMGECLEIQLSKTGEHTYKFEYYRAVSAGEVPSSSGTGYISREAGLNGVRHWGIHYFTSSLPGLGWSAQKLVFHEYFHAVQHSHLQTKDHDKRQSVEYRGPRAFVEAGADYMAFTALSQAHLSGDLDVGTTPYVFEETMEQVLKIPNYRPYVWYFALLDHKFGYDVLLDVFYPNLEELGWEGAFVKAYGISPKEFHDEFLAFLDLPVDQQLAILSKVD